MSALKSPYFGTALTDDEDSHKVVISPEATEDVERAIKLSGIEHIEDLAEHERVEDERLEIVFLAKALEFVCSVVAENRATCVVENECDGKLED